MKFTVEPEAMALLSRLNIILKQRKIKVYLVGGLMRDTLLGRQTADIDIAVDTDALRLAPYIADELGGVFVPLDTQHGIARIVLPVDVSPFPGRQCNLDISTITGDIEQDLARRDFTIDAIAVDLERLTSDPAELILLDPHDGQTDLQQKIIRSVSDGVFEEDAVRLLRAVRLAAELGFRIAESTEAQIRRCSHLLAGIAGERLREELLRILALPQSAYYIRQLDRLGLLTVIFPELEPARGATQPKEHVWDVFDHSLETVAAVEFLLRTGDWRHTPAGVLRAVPWSEQLARYFAGEVGAGSTRGSLLKLAALLHDVAKPQTKTIEPDGRIRFLGHPEEGARITVAILERLRFGNREIKQVELMVKYHMRAVQMSQNGLPTPRAIYRFFRDAGDAGVGTIFLSLADHLAARGSTLDFNEWAGHTREMEYVLLQKSREETTLSTARLVDGHEIMAVFGLEPGPRLGRILEEVREAQAAGELATREQALDYVREHFIYERV